MGRAKCKTTDKAYDVAGNPKIHQDEHLFTKFPLKLYVLKIFVPIFSVFSLVEIFQPTHSIGMGLRERNALHWASALNKGYLESRNLRYFFFDNSLYKSFKQRTRFSDSLRFLWNRFFNIRFAEVAKKFIQAHPKPLIPAFPLQPLLRVGIIIDNRGHFRVFVICSPCYHRCPHQDPRRFCGTPAW